nr:MAG TPA: hypothetical protein [Caudoviricetes sp.]
MEILKGLLLVNGNDIYTEYGAFLSEENQGEHKNYSALFKLAKSKGQTGVNFPERNGRKYPAKIVTTLDERSVELRFSIEAYDTKDFLLKYSSFVEMLRTGDNGWLKFYFPEILKTYKFFYEDCTDWDQLTPFQGKVYASFKVKFKEPEPEY